MANPPPPLLQKLLAGEQDDIGIGEEAVVENSASATFQVLPSILAPSIQKRAWHSCTIDVLRIWSRLQRRWMAHPPTPAISQISLAARGAPPKRCDTAIWTLPRLHSPFVKSPCSSLPHTLSPSQSSHSLCALWLKVTPTSTPAATANGKAADAARRLEASRCRGSLAKQNQVEILSLE